MVDGDVPTRTTLMLGWLVLLGVSVALFAIVAVAAWWQRRRELPHRTARLAERAEQERHTARLAARARPAAARAAAARERTGAAERARVGAWQELDRAQKAHDGAVRRHADLVELSGGDQPDRSAQQEVVSAALAAYRRGDLSGEQMWRVVRWGSGGDPDRERCEHELLRARADLREAHLRYRSAAARERADLAAAGAAELAARALAEEAAGAAAAEVDEASGAGMARWSG
jgi:hypothetical protein